jgi:hypothetical protein
MNNEDENRDGKPTWGLIVVIIFIVIMWVLDNRGLNRALDNVVGEYHDALSGANSNIEELNSIIEDAQSHTWSSYDEMGQALDELYTVDTIPDPYSCYPDCK